ncbi:uncharacterized protein TRIADDRAFT_60445 [Trichoplax adhaerens]|uniref:Uncharacterized protein n=1 Tax=Trichoplax adhaerens TaxID=10228 RepID=B3S884_TRIAD|nr:hypothetical protein TRIADDRAFT_60445 [Trichoplax adhaerens]EDV21057.1 hypothetical protein TRIADDRAFT_60445 [Trichoplax adhaerens]|eukprot:XP_002116387.1 hypothetical protein TRIADDRAFT_60445 [Trichoplax adhaerens]
MPSLNSLKRIAFYGGIASLGANLSKGGYFKKSLALLHDDKRAMEILGGPPISVGYIHLLDLFNYIDGKKAQLSIPVTGRDNSGKLIARASRESIAEGWIIDSLIVDIDQKESITIVEGPTVNYRKLASS